MRQELCLQKTVLVCIAKKFRTIIKGRIILGEKAGSISGRNFHRKRKKDLNDVSRRRYGAKVILTKRGCEEVEFGQRLRQLREKKRISRKVLSELCGLNSDAVRRYERGEAEPTLTSLVAMAEFFNVTVDYLVGRCN